MNNCFTAYPPEITEHPKSIRTDISASISFQCTSKPYGNIQIQWNKVGSSKLPKSATTFTNRTQDGVISTLKFKSVIHPYMGYYYCTVKNEIGEVNSSVAQLHINSKSYKRSMHLSKVCFYA